MALPPATAAATTSTTYIVQSSNYSMSTMDIVYVTVTTVSSLLSVSGCLVIIGAHVVYRMLRTTGRAMLVQLSIADMFTALGNILGVAWYLFKDSGLLDHSMTYCTTQSAWTILSSIASFLWTVAIAIAMCWAILTNRPTTVDRYWNIFMVVCWGVPVLVTIVALSCDVLGYDPNLHQASWCWIDPEAPNPLFWTFFTGKAWELSASVLTLGLYSAIKLHLFRHKVKTVAVAAAAGRRRCRRDVIQEANVKLTFVPLVFIVLRAWGTVRFLMAFLDHRYASSAAASWIVPLQGFGDSAQGFANFVMYCFFNHAFRKRLFRCCLHSRVGNDRCTEQVPHSRTSHPSVVRVISTGCAANDNSSAGTSGLHLEAGSNAPSRYDLT